MWSALFLSAVLAQAPSPEGLALYESAVKPLFAEHCAGCHSRDAKSARKLRGGLMLDTRDLLLAGGESGPAVVPGDARKSLLVKALRHDGLKMPPKAKLPARDVANVEKWVKLGAPMPAPAATLPRPVRSAKPPVLTAKRGVEATAKAVDAFIDAKLRALSLTAAEAADEATFLRRAYLDITGRVPTLAQATAYLDSKEPDRREKLIDDLLASPAYGEHFGRVWRDWIAPLELPSEGNGGNQPIVATKNLGMWFGERFAAGDGWDAIVTKTLTADGTLKDQPQGLFFSLVGDDRGRPDAGGTARAVTSLFMGVQMQCAQCHDDPFKEWKQAEFWGVAAFFRNTSWTFKGRYFDSVTESPEAPKGGKGPMVVKDSAGAGRITIPKTAFKNSGSVVPAAFLGGDLHAVADKTTPLRPTFAKWLTAKENPYFARAFVNRTWAMFMGRGVLHPIDDFRQATTPSHPELLEALTSEFVASGFDVKHLVRCVVRTKAYARSSRPLPAKDSETLAAFGRMPLKVMSADTLYDSLRLSLADPALDLRSYDSREAGRFGESSPVGTAYDEFARLFATNRDDGTDFTHGIPQQLALLNHPRLRTGGKMVEAVVKKDGDAGKVVESLYLATLSRRPTGEEKAEAMEYLRAVKVPRKGYDGLLWTLVNRSEYLLVR